MSYSDLKKQNLKINRRTLFLLLGKLSLFSIVSWKLFDIQILKSQKYRTLSKKNQINFEVLYPLRGIILDRNNIVIASNENTYDLFLIPEHTEDIQKTLEVLNNFISIDFKQRRKIINLSTKVKKFQNIKILKNIDWKALEVIEANKSDLPGLYLQKVPQRNYPYAKYFSHILGYTNKPSEKDLKLPFINDMLSLDIGKTGVEKISNNDLIGYPGKREIEVNAFGREIREISVKNSQQGKNVFISLDSKIQKFVHDEINSHKAASVVLLDIKTGEIISMVSIPDYNPNMIIKKPNNIYWNELLSNKLSPLTNRSIQGLYAPGSAFKMIVALAGLEKGVIRKKDTFFCSGKIEYGDRFYHCWKTKGHGKMNLVDAIKESCDVYFYELSKKIGIDDIAKVAMKFGLGEVTNVGLEDEKKGLIPSKDWKKKVLKQNWYAGETLNTAIGQGYTLSTPLQLAIMTSRIASNGKNIVPSIFKITTPKQFKQINFNAKHFEIIKEGMFNVVNTAKGTAYKSRSNKYEFSGKTGTSQVKIITAEEREDENFRKKVIEWKNKDHALFVGYFPSEKPRYALSVIVEHGGSGAATAAPIAKKIFDYLYKT